MKKIMLVCGSGIVTSTVVKKRIEEALNEKGYEGKYEITQTKASEVAETSKDYDLCISTTIIGGKCDCPLILASAFIMGRDTEEITEKICAELDK